MKLDNFDVFSKRIDEAKDDNLHQFVQYMREYGKQDELKPCSATAYDKFSKNTFSIEDAADSFDENVLNELVFDYCYDNDIEMCDEDDCEIELPSDIMCDPMEFIEDMDDFNEYCINLAEERIFDDLIDDERNMIYIEREICVPNFINKDKFYDLLKQDYDGKLGIWWTYCEGNAQAQWGGTGEYIRLYGYVSPEDVDWDETIRANLYLPEEKELTLKDGAIIELDCVKTVSGHTIFKGNLLYKA